MQTGGLELVRPPLPVQTKVNDDVSVFIHTRNPPVIVSIVSIQTKLQFHLNQICANLQSPFGSHKTHCRLGWGVELKVL